MKIKKAELLALIKEEIMSEMDGLTMMDDPYDDSQEPESFKVMDKVANEIESMIVSDNDEAISILSNYLVTAFPNETVQKLSSSAYSLFLELGYRSVKESDVEAMIQRETQDEDEDEGAEPYMMEGLENITPENVSILMDAAKKLSPLLATMSLPVMIMALREIFTTQTQSPDINDGGAM